MERPIELLLLRQLATLGVLRRQLGHGRHAHDAVLALRAQPAHAQGDVEGGVPGHFLELERELAGDARVHHDLEAAHVGHEPDDVDDVGVLEVDADASLGGDGRRAGRGHHGRGQGQGQGKEGGGGKTHAPW